MNTAMSDHVVDMGKDFSRYPAGRTDKDGKFNGTAFRDIHLLPYIRKGNRVVVMLDSGFAYGSSFLEEAFGGLVRAGVDKKTVVSMVDLKTEDSALREEIVRYLESAKPLPHTKSPPKTSQIGAEG